MSETLSPKYMRNESLDLHGGAPTGCFVAGTLVHTKDGLKPIEEIQVGDWVLSKPEGGSGETTYKRVTRTVSIEDQAVWTIEVYKVGDLDDKGMYRAVKRLIGTPNHPFWVMGKGWTALRNVTIHDQLVMEDGSVVGVTHVNILNRNLLSDSLAFDLYSYSINKGEMIDLSRFAELEDCTSKILILVPESVDCDYEDSSTHFRAKVYNFEVEEYHTYFVGTLGVWVRAVGGAA